MRQYQQQARHKHNKDYYVYINSLRSYQPKPTKRLKTQHFEHNSLHQIDLSASIKVNPIKRQQRQECKKIDKETKRLMKDEVIDGNMNAWCQKISSENAVSQPKKDVEKDNIIKEQILSSQIDFRESIQNYQLNLSLLRQEQAPSPKPSEIQLNAEKEVKIQMKQERDEPQNNMTGQSLANVLAYERQLDLVNNMDIQQPNILKASTKVIDLVGGELDDRYGRAWRGDVKISLRVLSRIKKESSMIQ